MMETFLGQHTVNLRYSASVFHQHFWRHIENGGVSIVGVHGNTL